MAQSKLSFLEQELQAQLQFNDAPPFYFAHYAAELRCWTVAHLSPSYPGTATVAVQGTFAARESMLALADKMNRARG